MNVFDVKKLFSAVKKVTALTLTAAMIFSLMGCGAKKEETQKEGSFSSAAELLTSIYDKTPKDFPVLGGNVGNITEDAPGTLDLKDTDTMTNILFIPEDVQKCITDAATVSHMMNVNTFTGVALRLDGMSPEDAAAKLKDAFETFHFIDAIPDRISTYVVEDYVIYFFGADELVSEFDEVM